MEDEDRGVSVVADDQPSEANTERESIRTGFLLQDVDLMRKAVFGRNFRPVSGLTSSQAWVLINLTRHGDAGLAQVELARLRKVGKATLGRIIDKLERQGFVDRIVSLEDRREKRIRLTLKGHAVIERMRPIAIELGAKMAAGISPEKQVELRRMLSIMKRNLSGMDLESASTRRKSPRPDA